MPSRPASLTLLAFLLALAAARPARGDAFDYYHNRTLQKMTQGKDVKEIKKLDPSTIVDHDRVLPGVPSAFLIVQTNGGRMAKLLVQAAKQKVDAENAVPILWIERFVTYKEGEEQTRHAEGKNLSLFAGFRLGLDLGQVVPEALGGDLRFVVDGDKIYTEPLGKAKLYLVTRHNPDVIPKKAARFVMGDKFEPKYFTGSYKLHDDGRRSGRLVLKVEADGEVRGAYYSDKDGQKYDVEGKIGTPQYAVEFRIKFPRTEQTFKGMLFTGDGKAIAGTSRMAEREAAFYAVREQE
jgi:hypothetical protein